MSIKDCVEAYDNLIGTKYVFTIGRKNSERDIVVHFNKSEFKHLVGLHYLKDIRSLRGSSEKLYDSLKNGEIAFSTLEKSFHYHEIESDRVALFPHLKELIEANKIVFRFNKTQSPYTKIIHEYVMELENGDDTAYLFLNKSNSENEYSCVSFFRKDRRDYTKGQTRWTVLQIKRLEDDTEDVIYRNKNYIKNE